MQIIESDVPELTRYLQERKAAGDNWVAYPLYYKTVSVHSVNCFSSAFEAGRHCAEMGIYDTIHPGTTGGEQSFMSIDVALTAINEREVDLDHIDKYSNAVRRLLDEWQVMPAFLRSVEDLVTDLSLMELTHVVMKKPVIPSEEIEKYRLVLHEHAVHSTIYEIGHSHKLILSTDSYTQAFRELEIQGNQLRTNIKGHYSELVLAGQFRNQPLLLDEEGRPMLNTGVTIATASLGDDGKLVQQFRDRVDEKVVLQQDLFVKFDPEGRQFLFFDDQLNPINPGDTLRSVSAFYFLNAPFEIIQHPILQAEKGRNAPVIDVTNIPAARKIFEFKPDREEIPSQKAHSFLHRLINRGKRMIARGSGTGRKNKGG